MKVRDLHPEWVGMDQKQFLEKVSMNFIHPIIRDITEYYDSALSIPSIYDHYGIPTRVMSGDEMQVPCILLEHGGSDTHNSARFYRKDRNTGRDSQRLWCFKCQKLQTPFWVVYQREVDYNGASFREVLKGIWDWFRVPFPMNLVLDFDPATHYQMEDAQTADKLRLFVEAEEIRAEKMEKPEVYLSKLKRFWKTSYS